MLDAAGRRWRLAPFVLAVCIAFAIPLLLIGNSILLSLFALLATIFIPAANFLDRYRRSIKIHYKVEGVSAEISDALAEGFEDLRACKLVWSIRTEGNTFDWKRNAGATRLNTRHRIRPQFDRPSCIRSGEVFPALKFGSQEIYFLPDAALVVVRGAVTAIDYHDLCVASSQTRFIEDEKVPVDTVVVDQTWRYVNKNGGPDRRFQNNKQLPICLYGEIGLSSEGGFNAKLHFSNPAAGDRFTKVVDVLCQSSADLRNSAVASFKVAGRWPTFIFFGVFFCLLAAIIGPHFIDLAVSSQVSERKVSLVPNSQIGSGPVMTVPQSPTASATTTQTPNGVVAPVAAKEPALVNPSQAPMVNVPLPRPRPKSQTP